MTGRHDSCKGLDYTMLQIFSCSHGIVSDLVYGVFRRGEIGTEKMVKKNVKVVFPSW